jgi:hypothetical protein
VELELFPLADQITNGPHECLMPFDQGLGGGAIVVKAGRRHRLFQVFDGLFALGDARFERVDLRLARLLRARSFSRFGVAPFFLFVGRACGSDATFFTRAGPRLRA